MQDNYFDLSSYNKNPCDTGNNWNEFFFQEMTKPYFRDLDQFITQKAKTDTIYPPKEQIFRAFSVDPNDIRVVILGQDPYHEEGQAMGLAFSVPDTCKTPPSLRNIKKELTDDLGIELPGNNLQGWAEQGVFLLNTVLLYRGGRQTHTQGMDGRHSRLLRSSSFVNTIMDRWQRSYGENRHNGTNHCLKSDRRRL